jgi:hypothetical protein
MTVGKMNYIDQYSDRGMPLLAIRIGVPVPSGVMGELGAGYLAADVTESDDGSE